MRTSLVWPGARGSALRGLCPLLLLSALACGSSPGATSTAGSGGAAGSGSSSGSGGAAGSGSSSSGSGGAAGSGSSSSGSGGGSTAGVGVTGAVIYHSLNKLATQMSGITPDYSGLTISLLDEGALLANPAVSPLATGPLSTTGCPAMGGCPYSFASVDLTGASVGLATRVSDTRSTPVWATTETGSMSAAELATLQKSGGAYADGRGFALSLDAVDSVLAKLVGLTGDELLAGGLVFGLVYSTPSTNTASGQALAGATVKPSGTGLTVVYPTANFSATQTTTGGQGVFLLVPAAAGTATSVTVTVTPPSGQALTWDATQAAVLRPGAIYFMILDPT